MVLPKIEKGKQGSLSPKTENKSQKRTGHHHAHSHTPTCNLLRYKSVQTSEDTNYKLQTTKKIKRQNTKEDDITSNSQLVLVVPESLHNDKYN